MHENKIAKMHRSSAVGLLKRTRYELILLRKLEIRRAQLHSGVYPGSLKPKTVQVQESAPQDKLGEIEATVAAIDYQIVQTMAAITRRRERVFRLIAQIDSELHQQILILYYCTSIRSYEELGANKIPFHDIALLSLADVAARLGKSHGHIRNAHREALRAFKRVYEEEGGH